MIGALAAGLSGLVYGVEEFVFLALVVGALLCLGVAIVTARGRACRQSVRLVTAVPQAEIGAGQVADAELTVINTGRRPLPSMLVVVADANWTLSFPGLAHGALAARRRAAEAAERPRPARGFAEPSDRRTRRQRAADRRAVNGADALDPLAAGAQALSRFAVPSNRRGVLTLSGVTVWCQDPFGLAARRVAVAPPAHVIVYPAPTESGGDQPRRGARPGRHPESGATLPTNALSGDELSGLRPYAPGDRLTRLHWPSLARAGELLVREFVEPDSGSLSLLVDLRPSAHTAETFERTIASAAGMGTQALARGVTVELCTSAGDRLTIPVGTAGRQTLLRALALLGPTAAPSAAARRWGGSSGAGAVWATTGAVSGTPGPARGADPTGDVVLVTTAAGAQQDVLPVSLRPRADTVVVR
jgi:uncharacterized protein (DUF58 family)